MKKLVVACLFLATVLLGMGWFFRYQVLATAHGGATVLNRWTGETHLVYGSHWN